jgi:hypothetical protein
MSRGESVPEVITTVWKRSKIGLTAIDASKHLKINFSPQKFSPKRALPEVENGIWNVWCFVVERFHDDDKALGV